MKGKQFSEEQILRLLHDAEAAGDIRDVCRQYNIAEQTLYRSSMLRLLMDGG
jgi:hypothetical protein